MAKKQKLCQMKEMLVSGRIYAIWSWILGIEGLFYCFRGIRSLGEPSGFLLVGLYPRSWCLAHGPEIGI